MGLFEGPSEHAKICVDGQKDIDVPYGLNISISKTKKTLKLVHPKDNDFFEACREKLGWSLNLSKKQIENTQQHISASDSCCSRFISPV